MNQPGPLLILHTTEGTTAQGAADWMRKQRTMSHRVYNPTNNETIQLVPWNQPARSLRNLTGGVETNNRPNVYQLEIVGHAEAIPTYDPLWYENLAVEILWICDELDIPRTFPAPFIPYPASYGKHNGIRLTNTDWLNATGIIGHCHVPENTHGDPGDITRLIPLITGAPTPMPTPDNPYANEVNEALQILTDHAGYTGTLDGWFGPKALAALHTLKNRKLELMTLLDTAENEINELLRQNTIHQLEADDAELGAAARKVLDVKLTLNESQEAMTAIYDHQQAN